MLNAPPNALTASGDAERDAAPAGAAGDRAATSQRNSAREAGPSGESASSGAFSRALLLALGAAAGTLILSAAMGGVVLWWKRRTGGSQLRRRLARAAAPLAGFAAEDGAEGAESIFRPVEKRTWLSGLWARLESRYPLLDPRRALPAAAVTGVAGAAGSWLAMWFLKVPSGGWTMPIIGLCAAGAAWYSLRWLQARQVAEFLRLFPETVDQIVRLSKAGVPALEALATVAEDAPPPVGPVLANVRDGLLAGLDSDTTLRLACERVRIGEFTLFAAVLGLQRRAGGGVSGAFQNLSETLRERRKITLKAQASTAQTRLTLVILAVMPVLVLIAQRFISPQSVDVLFNTESGTTLLHWGTGLILTGLLVARAMGARATR